MKFLVALGDQNMPTVTQVLTVQPAPGKLQQCLELGRKWKKIRERAGAKERLYTNTAGALFIVIETPGWKEFGEIIAKVRADRDAQALLGGDAIEFQPSRNDRECRFG